MRTGVCIILAVLARLLPPLLLGLTLPACGGDTLIHLAPPTARGTGALIYFFETEDLRVARAVDANTDQISFVFEGLDDTPDRIDVTLLQYDEDLDTLELVAGALSDRPDRPRLCTVLDPEAIQTTTILDGDGAAWTTSDAALPERLQDHLSPPDMECRGPDPCVPYERRDRELPFAEHNSFLVALDSNTLLVDAGSEGLARITEDQITLEERSLYPEKIRALHLDANGMLYAGTVDDDLHAGPVGVAMSKLAVDHDGDVVAIETSPDASELYALWATKADNMPHQLTLARRMGTTWETIYRREHPDVRRGESHLVWTAPRNVLLSFGTDFVVRVVDDQAIELAVAQGVAIPGFRVSTVADIPERGGILLGVNSGTLMVPTAEDVWELEPGVELNRKVEDMIVYRDRLFLAGDVGSVVDVDPALGACPARSVAYPDVRAMGLLGDALVLVGDNPTMSENNQLTVLRRLP